MQRDPLASEQRTHSDSRTPSPGEGRVRAPFTPAQVDSLNEYQESGVFHPFTCGRCRDADERWPSPDEHLLTAAVDGWRCPTCDYEQEWAWEWMADGSWVTAFDWKRFMPTEQSGGGQS